MTVLDTYLNSSPLHSACIVTRSKTCTVEDVVELIAARRKFAVSQGLSLNDCVSLPMGKQSTDWLNLLALSDVCAAIVLIPQHNTLPVPDWVTVEVTNPEKLQLNRRAQSDTALQKTDDPLIAVQSSGSTGQPKTVWHRLSHFINSANASNELLPLTQDDASLVSLPLNHVGGLGICFRALVSGSRLVFDAPADDLEQLISTGISRLSLVPTQLYRLLAQGQAPAQTSVILGGAPMATELIHQARHQGWQLHRSYGLSEMASQVITETKPDYWQVLPHAQVQTLDDELYVNGASLFLGYGAPTALSPVSSSAGFATRDLAKWHPPSFTFLGRKDNVFVCGGENVQPESVEARFINAFHLSQCLLLPVDNAEWGHRPVLLVSADANVNRAALADFARASLFPHERPVEYYELPPQGALKPSRTQLIEKVRHHDLEKIH